MVKQSNKVGLKNMQDKFAHVAEVQISLPTHITILG
jgi:hypothetical protein